MNKICLCKVCFKLKASEKHVSRFLDASLGKCVSIGSCPLPILLHPHQTSMQRCWSWYFQEKQKPLWFIFPVLFWMLWGGYEKAVCIKQKYFFRIWGGCSLVWREPRLPRLILILFLMFMGTSLTCLAEFRVWIFGRFLFEPSLAVFQNVQIAHIKSE